MNNLIIEVISIQSSSSFRAFASRLSPSLPTLKGSELLPDISADLLVSAHHSEASSYSYTLDYLIRSNTGKNFMNPK